MAIRELGKGKAQLVVSVGSRATRRRITKVVTYTSKKELKRLYQEFEDEALRKPLTDITVGELMQNHIDHIKSLGRSANTIRGYEICMRRFSEPFRAISAKDLSTYSIEKEVALWANKGRLSAKTISNTISFLSSCYEHGIHTRMLESNPCEYVTKPKGKSKDARILYKDELMPFLNSLQYVPIDDEVAYLLALFLGLRRSELLGLKESDVDIVNGTIRIHETRHRVHSENLTQTTKTERSTRVLALPDILLVEIARLLDSHRQFPYEKTDYLIWNGFGEPINPQALSSRLTRHEEKYGLPHVTLHGLRHTYASLLNASGVDMSRISRELGHSNLTTTANIYTHIFQDASQSSKGIAQTVDNLLTEYTDADKQLSTGQK